MVWQKMVFVLFLFRIGLVLSNLNNSVYVSCFCEMEFVCGNTRNFGPVTSKQLLLFVTKFYCTYNLFSVSFGNDGRNIRTAISRPVER